MPVNEMTQAERDAVRHSISEARARATTRAQALEATFANIVEASADAVRDDEHDPEGATIAFERAQIAALLADARREISALDQAAARLEDADAGRCERCAGAIGLERLQARPASTRCVRCAS